MKTVEENNFIKYVERFVDGVPVYNYLNFVRIADWMYRESGNGLFGSYAFSIADVSSTGEEFRSGYIWVGAEGTCIIYDGILYEDDTDFEKLQLKLEQERVSDILEKMEG